jgi:hypothetical protein
VLAHSAELVEWLEHLVAPFAPRWTGADPFAAAVETAAPAPRDVGGPGKVEAPEVELAELVPTAIVLSPTQGPIAILDGKVCRPGDIVAGRVVVAIEERRVVLRSGNQTYAVSMPLPELGGSR